MQNILTHGNSLMSTVGEIAKKIGVTAGNLSFS